ncbi:short-chain dehydrogenase/reductase SDR [Blyttiomyces helicus]|uniref:Short-chain dehydrogenase/reductase SDR n=1 Tax=Blyttiomyces helicus TaxID=388810 RepID=A0A4P9WAE1_9FUNG|nr:short-chain dehydrogenase/reductase SDR [Blyttiomyces helicus]|eukprot:RKO89404.1 short-chain dehydrogenase/reductase SDR [Blyttiomyces helicus]
MSSAASKPLAGKVAIITGGSKGIGQAISVALASAGASVVVSYAGDEAGARATVAAAVAAGADASKIQIVRSDVSKSESVRSLFESAVEHFGGVDIVINNAGIILYKSILDTSDEEFDNLFNTNVKGAFFVLREAARTVRNGGRVISISSSTTALALPTYGTYSGGKAAVEQMSRVLCKEVGARGITVNVVSPGPTDTALFRLGKDEATIAKFAAMNALGRLGKPEDIAAVVVSLAGESGAFVSGQNLRVNGGFV